MHLSTAISPATLITLVGLELFFKYKHKYSLHSEGSKNNWGRGPIVLCSFILHHCRARGYFLKCLSDFPKLKSCVSEQAFPLSPGMCLLWSLHTQTGENNCSNCWLNGQAWISRLYLRVLSCQVARQFSVAPESHYSQHGHCDFHFPSTVLNPTLLPCWFQLPRLGGGGVGTHLQSLCHITRRLLCVCACLFANPVQEIQPLMVLS